MARLKSFGVPGSGFSGSSTEGPSARKLSS